MAPADCELQRAEIFDTTYHFEIPPFWLRLSTSMLSLSCFKHWETFVLQHRKLFGSFGCFFFSCLIDFGGRHFESREGVGRVCSHRLLVIIHHALMTCADVHESPSQARLHLRLLVRVYLHLHRPLSLGGHVETRGNKASLGQTRIQCETYRARTKLFILLRLKMAAV